MMEGGRAAAARPPDATPRRVRPLDSCGTVSGENNGPSGPDRLEALSA